MQPAAMGFSKSWVLVPVRVCDSSMEAYVPIGLQ